MSDIAELFPAGAIENVTPAIDAMLAEESAWPEADRRYLRVELPAAPMLPLDRLLSPALASWVQQAAQRKGAPADYVLAGLLSISGSLVGNARWANPWEGWREPPILWCMIVGNPSAGKSPALDAPLEPLRAIERDLRADAKEKHAAWEQQAEVAKMQRKLWEHAVKAALKDGKAAPPMPAEAQAPPEPVMPRLAVNDATIEKLGLILEGQPRGTLLHNDELARWLMNLARYSNGSDRPFWLEAYGGRAANVERVIRETYIPRLSIGIVGGIQPDRLQALLLDSEDDGLLARFLPFWPKPVPLARPGRHHDDNFMEGPLQRLWNLPMCEDRNGNPCPRYVPFTNDAREALQSFRERVRDLEAGAEGLLLSFIGKLPGMAIRLALVLAFLDYAAQPGGAEPETIPADAFRRAALFLEEYALPMAQRTYAAGASRSDERKARKLLALIREKGWGTFSTREALRCERSGIDRKDQLDPAIEALVEAGNIRRLDHATGAKGGRPAERYEVHPDILRALGLAE